MFGGQDGIRDDGVLRSGLATPEATFDGVYLHSDEFMMAAAYAFHIAEGQPFVDGNKRTALNAALVFLEINGWSVDDPRGEFYDAMIGLATGTHTKSSLALAFSSPLATRERLMPTSVPNKPMLLACERKTFSLR